MSPALWTPAKYPSARRSGHVDVYKSALQGEVCISDPYQWLEEKSKEADDWIAAQAAFTRAYLDQNQDSHELEDRFRASMNYAKFSAPTLLDDGHWYWFYNTGLQSQPVIYRSKEPALPDFSKEDKEVGDVFFDSNVLSADGSAVVTVCRFSPCGKYFAYAISHLGGDYSTIYVRPTSAPLSHTTTVEDDESRLQDEVKWFKFSSVTWMKDSKGFLYQRFPPRDPLAERVADGSAMICYHRVGTPQSEDIIVYQDISHPEWVFDTNTSADGKYLFLYQYKNTAKLGLVWVADLDEGGIKPEMQWRKVINEYVADYNIIANHGSLVYARTNLHAPQYKLITIDLSHNGETRDLIPEAEDAKLVDVTCVNKEYFVTIYKRNAKNEIYLYSKDGVQLERLAEDFVGAATIVNREKQPYFFVTLAGFNTPGVIARYDFTAPESQRFSILRTTKVNGLDPDEFESKQVWYESHDGVNVPMFIVRHKSTEFDGTAAAIQYGYGGFAISADPFFSPIILTFLKMYGAILAVPNIRGGGEFGEEWHKSGRRENKGNSFDDFISAAQFLVKNKYAAPSKVVISGASNGGFLVCGSIIRAPEGTFGAAIAEGGVADLLKFHKFTGGKAWTGEYGDPRIPEDFDFIHPLSPLHNAPTDKALPATLLMVNAADDRVVPMHSFKFIATLQHNLPQNPNPLLFRVDTTWLGHGYGKSTDRHIKDAVDKWGFVVQSLGLTRTQSTGASLN